MKKGNIINLIKYHTEKNENAFINEAIIIAKYFDTIGDNDLAEYIYSLLSSGNIWVPQTTELESIFLNSIETKKLESLHLPDVIIEDMKGVVNAVSNNINFNKFLFVGSPGTRKNEILIKNKTI